MFAAGRFSFSILLAVLIGGVPGPAAAQFNPLSGIVGAIEAAAEDRSSSDIAADLKIKTALVSRLTDKLGKEGALMGVDVYEQDVMLTGTVPKADIKAQAGKIAAAAEGVRKVHNEILLEPDIAAADRGKSANVVDDTVIEAKIKALYVRVRGSMSPTGAGVRSRAGYSCSAGRSRRTSTPRPPRSPKACPGWLP